MSSIYFGRTGSTSPVVKNLIIINVLMFLGMVFAKRTQQVDFNYLLGLYYFKSPYFHPYQTITHMFMHGGIEHIFFNMFALWMFGKVLEQVWGPKRFFIYYMVTGLGAALLHSLVLHIEMVPLINYIKENYSIENFTPKIIENLNNMPDPRAKELVASMSIPTVGASGAVFGLLLGFGVLFPNTQLMLLFPPIPIRAKYFVIGYGLIELYLGITQPGSNIAHFAHLGGMLFGFIMISMWKQNRRTFY